MSEAAEEGQSVLARLTQSPLLLGLGALLLLPFAMPMLMIAVPAVLGILVVAYFFSSSKSEEAASAAKENGLAVKAEVPAAAAPPPFVPKVSTPPPFVPKKTATDGAAKTSASSAGAPLTGSAALLAKLKADRSKPVTKKKNVVVLYASQTGTCNEIAKGIAAEAAAAGLPAKAYAFNEFGMENITVEKAPIVVMVAASTGDGDPPENSAKCLVQLKRKSNPTDMLKGIKYTCLGLGDSNYTRFCAVPKAFSKRFQELGAECFHPNINIDEVDGIEEPVEQWCEELKPKLTAACKDEAEDDKENAPAPASASNGTIAAEAAKASGPELVGVPALMPCGIALVWEADTDKASAIASAERAAPSVEALAHRDKTGLYSRATPFWAKVSKCENLCDPKSEREVLHMEVDLSGSGMACHPGDALGVSALNSPELVDGILQHLKADGSRVFSVAGTDGEPAPGRLSHLRWPCTLRHALSAGCDITGVPKKSLLRMLAEYCTDGAEKQQLLLICSRGGKDEYKSDIMAGQPSLLDLLKRFKSCNPPIEHLLEALPPLAERLYSLSSSGLKHPNAAHVAFSVVNFTTERYGAHSGVATNWLKSICLDASGKCQSPRIGVYLRPNESFRPPSNLKAPLVMIGPGTGVAPFRGFLQERQAKKESGDELGPSWLFFGCRRRDEDFLYKSEMEGFAESGVLTHLETAFSREQAEKVYVQDRMRARGAELCEHILDPSSFVMICGDGAHMAKDVNSCLAEVLVAHGKLTEAEASAKLAQMTKERRYIRDIWS